MQEGLRGDFDFAPVFFGGDEFAENN